MRKANYIASGIFITFAIIIIIISSTYPPSNHSVPGPGMFPIIIASLIILSAIALTVVTIKSRSKEDSEVDLVSKNIINVYITMAGLIIYLILLPMLGFISTTFVMLLLYMKWYSKRSWWKCIIISLLFTLVIFFLFGTVLNVPIRFGLLI
ncbi:MAG TPA: tripartite tricarboxylate transporter TctB family protein [Sphaerochaeta sp.]|jgi:putative tricarboxylic transport membrane protein|nr:tripartite tricarboxylate transporter TctB family protein [Sphaerochaeta sp.]